MEPGPAPKLLSRYLIGLVLLACTTLGGLYVVQRSLARAAPDSRVLATLARQQMLSQRIAMLSGRLPDLAPGPRERAMDELNQAILEFRAAERELLTSRAPGLSPETSPRVATLLREIDPTHAALVREAGATLRRVDGREAIEPGPAAEAVAGLAESFVEGMDLIVRTYEAESVSRLGRARAVAAGLAGATLLVLAAEALLVFLPALRALRAYLTEQQRLLEQAEEAAAFKGRFLATMSHELRTPLSALVGYARLLDDPASAQDGEGQAAARAAGLRRSAEHLLALVQGTLDLSKIEAGRFELASQRVRLAECVGAAVAIARPMAMGRGLAFDVAGEGTLPEWIVADPTRLSQVLINLLSNAVLYTSAGGVSLRLRADQSRLHIEVTDTGRGIAPDRMSMLFRPFERGAGGDSSGAGLGLHIAKTIADRMGASLDARSRVGEGTTFALALPIDSNGARVPAERALAVDGAAEHAPPLARLVGIRVLLADDSADLRHVLRAVLERAGAEVDEASDGRQAVELATAAHAQARPYDAIILDVQMPGTSGPEAVGELRRLGVPGRRIALTAQTGPDDRDRALAAGYDHYLAKPVSARDLLDAIASAVRADPGAEQGSARAVTSGADVLALLEPDVVRDYRRSLAATIARAGDALRAGDVDAVRSIAHRLKGTAPSFGLPEVGAAAAEVERFADDGSIAALTAALERLQAAAARSGE